MSERNQVGERKSLGLLVLLCTKLQYIRAEVPNKSVGEQTLRDIAQVL